MAGSFACIRIFGGFPKIKFLGWGDYSKECSILGLR